MTAPPDSTAALLGELMARGIALQARGDRLRYRPRDRVTPALIERVKARKPELLQLLQAVEPDASRHYYNYKNTADDPVIRNTVVDDPPKPHYTVAERRVMKGTTDAVRAAADRIKRLIPTATVERIITPRVKLAAAIRNARQKGDHDRAISLREAWGERAAIMEFDGKMPRADAERAAVGEAMTRLTLYQRHDILISKA